MDPKIQAFTGQTKCPVGEAEKYARNPQQTLAEIAKIDRALDESGGIMELVQVHPQFCSCVISPGGHIDCTRCDSSHVLYPNPIIDRWFDLTTSLLEGAGYLIFWSGWARPSAHKLLGRFPFVKSVKELYARTPKHLQHHMKFETVNRSISKGSISDVVDVCYARKGLGTRPQVLFNLLQSRQRFGGHYSGRLQSDDIQSDADPSFDDCNTAESRQSQSETRG
jgi:hypothetical protein